MRRTTEKHIANCQDCKVALTINDLDLQAKAFVCPSCGSSKAEKPITSPPIEKLSTILKWSDVYNGKE